MKDYSCKKIPLSAKKPLVSEREEASERRKETDDEDTERRESD